MSGGERITYQAIKAEFSRRIADRVWPPGALIPGEEALAGEFGCARATVNRALQELARDGLVNRKRKSGTRVVLHPVREARLSIPLARHEIEAKGASYRYRLLGRAQIEPPRPVRARLGLSAAGAMLHVCSLHMADEAPYQYEDRWINLDVVPEAAEESFETVSPNEWLVETAHFSHAEFIFTAAAAGAEEAAFVEVAPGDPVFVCERLTWLIDQPVTLVRMVHPPSHRMITRI